MGKVRRATLATKLLLPAVAALALAGAWTAMAPAQGDAPMVSGHAVLALDTGEEILFREIVKITTEAVPGDKRDQPRRPSVVLRRGLTASDTLWRWHAQVRDGDAAARRKATLTLYDAQNERLVGWALAASRPTKIEATTLKADGNDVAIESIEISAERIDIDIDR